MLLPASSPYAWMQRGSRTQIAVRAPSIGVRWFAALVAATVAVSSGCARQTVGTSDGLAYAGAASGELQRSALSTVFYRGNPLPPEPDAEERQRARARVSAASEWERALLEELYPGDDELWALVMRDSDGDGIKDFRVSDYYGRLLEGDTDIDGDGRPNTFDLSPYERDPDGAELPTIPDHLSWRVVGKPAEMASIQEQLFREYGILLVERSASFTPELAVATFDAIARVHRSVLGPRSLPTLRVIASEESSLLFEDAEEGAGDFAQVLPATGTMEIYRRGIDAPPLVQLGFLSHEISHGVQYALDSNREQRRALMIDNEVSAPTFHALVARYGWSRRSVDADPTAEFELFRPQYIAPDAYEYLYREEDLSAWEDWLAAIYEEVGEQSYLSDPRITELYILGDYSLSSPWEWYSDHVIAYVYMQMFDALAERCTEAEVAELRGSAEAEVLTPQWPYFRFENARGAPFQQHLDEVMPIRATDAKDLARRYVPGSERCGG